MGSESSDDMVMRNAEDLQQGEGTPPDDGFRGDPCACLHLPAPVPACLLPQPLYKLTRGWSFR